MVSSGHQNTGHSGHENYNTGHENQFTGQSGHSNYNTGQENQNTGNQNQNSSSGELWETIKLILIVI